MMDAQQALARYLRFNPKAARDIVWLMGWDDKLIIKENLKKLGILSPMNGTNFRCKYELGFKNATKKVYTNAECLGILRKNGLNMSEISRVLGVSPQRIAQILEGK